MYQRQVLPSYAGISTFFRAPQADFDDLKPGGVAVVGVPFETTLGSRPGTRYGPQAIRASSLHLNYYMMTSPTSELVDLNTGEVMRQAFRGSLVDLGDLNVFPADVARTGTSVADGVAEILARENFPVILGGDHYLTHPAFLGFARAVRDRGARRLGYLQLDAHFDLAPDNPIWGRHFHGSNARLIAESGLIDPRHMVWVGVRGYARREQVEFARSSGMRYFTAGQVREQGPEEVLRRAGEELGDCDAIYLTIDIDVVDPCLAPGTGAINFGGLTPPELLEAVHRLRSLPVAAMDLVEVSPAWDPTGVTERLAAVAVLNFIAPRIFETAAV